MTYALCSSGIILILSFVLKGIHKGSTEATTKDDLGMIVITRMATLREITHHPTGTLPVGIQGIATMVTPDTHRAMVTDMAILHALCIRGASHTIWTNLTVDTMMTRMGTGMII